MSTSTEAVANVNLNAIAEHLNLSTATVSRALRNVPGIHPRTKSLVMNAAAELGYRPQRTRVRTGDITQRQSVGVLAHGVETGRTLAFLEGLTQAAHDFDVSLALQKYGLVETKHLFEVIKRSLSRETNLAGVLLIHRWSPEIVRFLADHYDCVSLVHQYPGVSMDVVDMNHVQGIRQLMTHLRELGHERIGFIGRNAELGWSKSRFGGYSQALFELGLSYEPKWVVDVPTDLLLDNSSSARWTPFVEHVANCRADGVTAWMASSDWAGYALNRGLLDLGIGVPDEISITGFDTEESQTLGCPRLTSVNVPKQEMGAEALARLLRRRENPQQPQHTSLFQCALFPGESTGRPHFKSHSG